MCDVNANVLLTLTESVFGPNLFNSGSPHRPADVENEDDVFGDRAERLWREGVDEVVVDDAEAVEVRLVIDVVFDDELVVEVA